MVKVINPFLWQNQNKKIISKNKDSPSKKFGILSLILGAIAIIFSSTYIGLVSAVLGITFFVIQDQKFPTKTSKWGLALNLIGIILISIAFIYGTGIYISGSFDIGFGNLHPIQKYRTYQDTNWGFIVEYPDNWEKTLENGILFFYSPKKDSTINIQVILKEKYKTKEQYIDSLLQQFNTAKNFKLLSRKEMTLDGANTTKLTVSYNLKGISYTQESTIIDAEGIYYMISYTSWKNYKNNLKVYEHLLKSFKV